MPRPKTDSPPAGNPDVQSPGYDEHRLSDGNDPGPALLFPSPAVVLPPLAILAGLLRLLQASDFARGCRCPIWEFAVEHSELRATGLTNTDLRWLVRQGYVQHAVEKIRPGQEPRAFGPPGTLVFPAKSCFALTEQGIALASVLRRQAAAGQPLQLDENGSPNLAVPAIHVQPSWNAVLRELRLAGDLVKAFHRPAANQELVLAAFEEDGWPPRIDNPISPRDADDDAGERLHRAINKLNGHQVHPLLRFRRDGSGEGVRWEIRKVNEAGSGPDRDQIEP